MIYTVLPSTPGRRIGRGEEEEEDQASLLSNSAKSTLFSRSSFRSWFLLNAWYYFC